MAHIKVERRSMRPEEWIGLRFGWLKRHIFSEQYEITSFRIREARQTSEMAFEFYDETPRPLHRGDLYFTPDGTAFIDADMTVPPQLAGKDYVFALKTAAEMIVKVNGVYAGGIDPNRSHFPISAFAKDNRLQIEIVAYNRSKPDDERNPESLSVRGCRQIFEGGYLAVVDPDVQSLVYDLELLTDAAFSGAFPEDFSALATAAMDRALDLIDFDHVRGADCRAVAAYLDKTVFSNPCYRGSGSVALVAHSHLDIAYYWRRIHAVQKNLRTVLIQLRLMDRYPDFCYAHTQAYTYESVAKYYPKVFEELKARVAEGRFEPVGAMYIEPDCNLSACESLIRQCLYGQKTYQALFGITVDTCWLPDVFGNSWILPQILKKSGVKYFVSNKMSTWNDTNRFPHNHFIWRGIDGSEVYACVPPTHFISWNMPSQVQANWEAYQEKNTGGQTLQMFGYGDGGSGATEEMVELMHRFPKLSVMPEITHCTAKEFLRRNFDGNAQLATWDGELYLEMHRGTFTTKTELKAYNRQLEFLFREAELRAALRMLQGADYPAEQLRDAYKKLMINQFHDILPGSHITPVYRDAMADLQAIEQTLLDVIGSGNRLFNSLNFDRTGLSFVPDPAGAQQRCGLRGETHVVAVSAFGSAELPEIGAETDWLACNGLQVTTPFYRIAFAPDGSIQSLYDLALDREWVRGDFNKLKAYKDLPGNYDAWDILPDYQSKPLPVALAEPLRLVSADAESACFVCAQMVGGSRWERRIRLFRAFRGIEVENRVDWQEKHTLVKAEFGCNVLTRELLCDTSAGIIRRETHRNTSWQQARFEVCHHKWFDLSEQGGGVAVINHGKYGVSAEESTAALSLLRATIRPDPTSDMGQHSFSYVIYPHAGDPVSAGVNRLAFEYNAPLLRGDFAPALPAFSPLWLQAVKLSEDGTMLVIRLSEQDGARGTLQLGRRFLLLDLLENVTGEAETLAYAPFEIKTLGLPLAQAGEETQA